MNIVPGIVELSRDYPVPIRDVYAAWSSAEAMLAWSGMPDNWAMRCEAFAMERGHEDRWVFGPKGADLYLNCNRYVTIESDRRIAYTTTLSHEGEMTFAGAVTVTFDAQDGGCRLSLVEAGVHLAGDDSQCHRDGWAGMLDALGNYLAGNTAAS